MLAFLLATFVAVLPGAEPQLPVARQAEQAGDLLAAEKAYENELEVRPSAGTWERLGLVRHLQNKFDAAIPVFREAELTLPVHRNSTARIRGGDQRE